MLQVSWNGDSPKDYNTEIGVGEHTDYGLLTILKQDMGSILLSANMRCYLQEGCCMPHSRVKGYGGRTAG